MARLQRNLSAGAGWPPQAHSSHHRLAAASAMECRPSAAHLVYRTLKLQLNLDVDACRQVQPCQRVNRLRVRVHHVDQALVRPHLEVLLGVLIDERRTANCPALDLRGQWNRTDKDRKS